MLEKGHLAQENFRTFPGLEYLYGAEASLRDFAAKLRIDVHRFD